MLAGAVVLAAAVCLHAAPPPQIPGNDITDEDMQTLVPRDSVRKHAPAGARTSSTWLDLAVQTWNAPTIGEQMAQDARLVPMGMGGVFVPRMTEGVLEPDIEIVDTVGTLMARGEPGVRYALLPGIYYVMIGSGSHKQTMVRTVSVEEARTTPVVPDWGGLSIETVDENGMPIRGEFELICLDNNDPYGRGFGPDPDLGEKPRTWILKPGLYKIFSVGESFNTQRNFITVQLMPGQLSPVLLIERKADLRIQGGGVVSRTTEKRLAQNWKYGIDVGGGALFYATIDRSRGDTTVSTNSTTISLLLNAWLHYEKSRTEWNTSFRLNEGFSFIIDSVGLRDFTGSDDEPRLQSLYIWRILKWFGPYGRFELQTALFPKFERRTQEEKTQFFIVDRNGDSLTINTKTSLRSEPSLSPMDIGLGVGANADILDFRYISARARLGFGYSFKSIHDKYAPVPVLAVDSALYARNTSLIDGSVILSHVESVRTHEAGPEAALTTEIRVGRWGTTGAEITLFAPVAPTPRVDNLDIYLEAYVSWRITRSVSLDYRYDFTRETPVEKELQVNKSQHRIQLRYSFSSR
jgi:hypothetical protein